MPLRPLHQLLVDFRLHDHIDGKALGDQLGSLLGRRLRTIHLLQRLLAWPDRLQQGPPLLLGQLFLRQRAEVVVLGPGHVGAGAQRRHLAVAHVGLAPRAERGWTFWTSGIYNGSSALLPATATVLTGSPSGSRAAAAIFNWGRSSRSLLWPNCNRPCSERTSA